MLIYLCLLFVFSILVTYVFVYLAHGRYVNCTCQATLHGKTAVITGGSSGIGFAVASELVKRGAKVIIASKNKTRGDTAVRKIKDQNKNCDVSHVEVDLADFNSVRRCAQYLLTTEPHIHILINNAGIAYTSQDEELSLHGYDRIFSTNYLGHFLLTYLLIDRLKASSCRIINVSSMSHMFVGRTDFPVRDPKHGDALYPHLQGYDMSKHCLILHVRELTRMYAEYGVTANAVHPGVCVDTVLWSSMKLFWPRWVANLVWLALKPVTLRPVEAAQTIIHCAVSKQLQSTSGKYFVKCAQSKTCGESSDPKRARQLWEVSMLLTGCHRNGTIVHPPAEFLYSKETLPQTIYEMEKNPYISKAVTPVSAPGNIEIGRSS